MKQKHIETFQGLNIKKDPLKTQPGEFSTMAGVRANNDVLTSIKEPSTTKIPVPVLKFANFGYTLADLDSIGLGATPLDVTPHGSAKSIVALKVTGSLAKDELITLFTAATYAGVPIRLQIFADDAGGTEPGTNVSTYADYTNTSATGPSPAYVGVINTPTQALTSNYWVGFEGGTNSALVAAKLYHGAGSGTDVWKVYNGSAWEAFTTAFPTVGASKPFFFVVGSSLSTAPDDMKLVQMPYKSTEEALDVTGTDFSKTKEISYYNMCTISAENETEETTQNIIFRPGKLSMPLGSTQTVTTMSHTLFVLKDGIVAATANNTQYCVPIILQKYSYELASGIYYTKVQDYRKLEIEYFNGSLIVAGYGTDSTKHSPCFYQMNEITADLNGNETNGAVGYPSSETLPEFPKKVNVFNKTILFSNSHTFPFRTYYGLPGSFSGFSSSVNFLNITDGNNIIAIEKYGSSLLYFTHHSVFALVGVPGLNAALREIKNTGLIGEYAVKNTQKGLFCGLNDGLFLYNGSWTPIPDNWGIFEEREAGATPLYLRFVDYPIENELYFFDTSIVKRGFAYILNYETGKESTVFVSSITSPTETADFLNTQIVYFAGTTAKQHEGSTTSFSKVSLITGWLDVDPNIENKGFKSISFEANTTSVSVPFTITATTDGGGSKTFNVDLENTSDIIKRFKYNFDYSGRLIKFTINAASTTTEQIKISRISIHYTDGKVI